MSEQPRYRTLGHSDFFADGRASRNRPEHTVAREDTAPQQSAALLNGKHDGKYATEFPETIAGQDPRLLLQRGQQRFAITCSACHGMLGYGDGMVVRRGFKQPPSFHEQRLRDMPAGQVFETITHGYGVMPSYGGQITPEDRWAIVAYLRALQLSQNFPADDLPASLREKLPPTQAIATPRS